MGRQGAWSSAAGDSPIPSRIRRTPASGRWLCSLQLSQPNPSLRASRSLPWPRRPYKAPAGPGGRCKASPHPRNKPPSLPALLAPGCRLQEGERRRREQARKGGVVGKRGGGGGDRRSWALPQLRSRSWRLRDMAGECRPVARWRRAALLYPRLGTSPGAGPGGSPAGCGSSRRALPAPAATGAPPRLPPGARGPRAFPPPRAPWLASPPLQPGRGDSSPRGTPRALALQTALARVTPSADPHNKARSRARPGC